MLSRAAGASAGQTGSARPRTRRSARAAAAAAAPALLEPGPADSAAQDSQGGNTAADGADCTAARQATTKRTRTGNVGLFSDASQDDVGAVAATVASPSAGGNAGQQAAGPTQTDNSASGGAPAKDSCAGSPPGADSAGASNAGQSAAAGSSAEEDRPDCGICLETCQHPVKLPCGHVFCFLCVKGAAKQSARCAYCRAEVTEKYINNPKLLDEAELERELADTDQGYHWLYQGRNGWWRYDERTSRDIEEAYAAQQSSVQVAVAGELYTIDLVALTQYNDQCRGRRRRIRREAADAAATKCKGVAGLRKRQRRQ